MPMKLNETLIDSCVVFFRLPGPSEGSFYEITFGRLPVRQENSLAFSCTPMDMNTAAEDSTHKFPQLTLSGVKQNGNKK